MYLERASVLAGLPALPVPVSLCREQMSVGRVSGRLENLALVNGEEPPSVASPGLVDSSPDSALEHLLNPPVAEG